MQVMFEMSVNRWEGRIYGSNAGRWVDEEVKSVKTSSDCNDRLGPVGSRSLAESEGRGGSIRS